MSRERAIWTAEVEWPVWGYGSDDGYTVRVVLDKDGRELHVRITNEQLVAMGKAAQRRTDEKAAEK